MLMASNKHVFDTQAMGGTFDFQMAIECMIEDIRMTCEEAGHVSRDYYFASLRDRRISHALSRKPFAESAIVSRLAESLAAFKTRLTALTADCRQAIDEAMVDHMRSLDSIAGPRAWSFESIVRDDIRPLIDGMRDDRLRRHEVYMKSMVDRFIWKPESDIDDRDISILPACDSQSDASADSVTDRRPESESEDIDIDECRFMAARCENNTALVRDTNITETMISCQKLGSNFLLRSISKDTPDEYFLSLKDMTTLKSCLGQVIITQTTSHISRQPDFCVEDPIVILARGEYKIVIDQDHHVVVVRRKKNHYYKPSIN